ncbi:MAG: hypothetical protein OXH00_17870 [Candidatus Poribacteria bacterium]|nr:hypothetical protein [Candidatus Poribacteria bacterium]
MKQNSSDDVREITRDAFLSTNDSDSIRCLRRLDGVRWAIGSAILHWFHERPYPTWTPHGKWGFCLDPKLKWNSTDWQKYVKCFRNALDKYEVCKRTLDRACREFGKAKMP